MFSILLWSMVICVVSGLVVKYVLDKKWLNNSDNTLISWKEFYITLGVVMLCVVPLTAVIGWKMSVNNKMTFVEYKNGWESEAVWTKTTCHRDGSCYNEYNCDPYIVMVTYTYPCGKNTCTGVRPETRYHSCPYTTEEWNFGIQSTLGFHVVDNGRFPENPNQHRWRGGVGISKAFEDRVGSGFPKRWLEVKWRLDSLRPGPVTGTETYTNYILASNTLFRKYEHDVQNMKSRNLLPEPFSGVYDLYHAEKIHFVNSTIRAGVRQKWIKELEYLNAGLGSVRQGDLHVVIVRNKVLNPVQYTQTLEAYWKSWEYHKENSIGKNAVVIVLGTENDSIVKWAEGFAGMPTGNEVFLQGVRSVLKNRPLDPDTIFGVVRKIGGVTRMNPSTVGYDLIAADGTKFVRTPMEKYAYLKGEVTPSKKSLRVLYSLCIGFSLLCWLIPVTYDDRKREFFRGYYR